MKVGTFYSEKDTLAFALEDIKHQMDSKLKDVDFLLFSFHPKYDYKDINYFVNKVFNTKNWIGFHALDAFADDKIVEGVVLLAIKFENRGSVNVFQVDDIEEKDALERTSRYLSDNKDKLNIIIGGLCAHKLGFFIEDLGKTLDYSPVDNIVGGLSSGYTKDGEVLTYIFSSGKVIKNGFAIITFENIEFDIGIALGFKPYGITYEIKKAEGYKIYEVDDGKNFYYVIQHLLKSIENPSVQYLWYCPINILDNKEGYVATLRTPKEIGEDYVEFFGPVKTGQKFKFSFADKDELLGEDRKIALKIKEKISHPDVLFNFSCIARQYVLEDKKEQECEIYTKNLNNHLFGFFTFGEIGPDKYYKTLKFYNETSLLVAMREL